MVLSQAPAAEANDPMLGQILESLSRYIANHPERLQTLDTHLVQRLQSLTSGIDVDLDAPLSPDGE